METVRAVKQSEPDPKAGQPRPKSGVSFPYYDLAQSVEVAKTMHEKAGGLCDRAQLAALLGYSGINNGSFLTRVSAAKMFGLIEDTDDRKVRVSPRGQAIVAPVSPADESRARVDAFLAIDLFKKIYDQFHGTSLPEEVGLRNLIENEYRVVPKQVASTVRVMLDSAEQVGLFKAGGKSRMVMPLSSGAAAAAPAIPIHAPAHPPEEQRQHENGGHGGGGGGDGTGIDPAFLGLLRRLPAPGTTLSTRRRKALTDAFSATVDFIYPEADESN